jgi:hypothetical protein
MANTFFAGFLLSTYIATNSNAVEENNFKFSIYPMPAPLRFITFDSSILSQNLFLNIPPY